jgi:hypothetical protein
MSQINWPIFPTLPAEPTASTDLTTWQIYQLNCDVRLKIYTAQLAEYSVSSAVIPTTDKQNLLSIVRSLLPSSTTTPANAVAAAQQVYAAYQAATNFSQAPV